MTHPRWVPAAIILWVFALAAPAPSVAAPKLYNGTISVHEFGNDLTTGSFTTGLGKTSTCPTKGVGLNKYGQVCGKGTTFATKSYYAFPIGRYCNYHYTGIGPLGKTLGMGDSYYPCMTTPTLHTGAPLTGKGTADTLGGSGPPGFTLMAGELRRTVMGSFPGCTYGCLIEITTAAVSNAAGSLVPGGGPGKLTFTPMVFGAFGQVKIAPGPRQFGGTLRLLGLRRSYDYYSTYKAGFLQIGYFNWLWSVIGGPTSNMKSYTNTVYNTQGFSRITSAVATGFPWTTGRVSVSATFGFPSILARTGYDNRNASGVGTIQLVSPKLTHWAPSLIVEDTAGVAILRLEFVPEPTSGLAVVCGVLALGILRRRRRG